MLMIIISHTYNGYPTDDSAYYFPQLLNYLHMELWGAMGVGVFLFLSGYGLFLSLSKRQDNIDRTYIISKIKRLFLPLLVYWVVEVLTLLIFNRQEISAHIFKEILTFSMHPDIENWFFKVILGAYIIIICLFKTKMNHGARIVTLFAVSLLYMIVMYLLGFGAWWYNTILCFPLGTVVAYRKKFFERLRPAPVCLVSIVLILALYIIWFNDIIFNIAFVFLCTYLIRLVNVNNRLLRFIGINSFLFYFIECPVMDEIMMFSYHNFLIYALLTVCGTAIIVWFPARLLSPARS